jgi:N-acyl homoserine lactone hydrolase
MPTLSVTRLVTGNARSKRGERGISRYVRDSWREDTVPVSAFLVSHPAGLCLFDTGQTARAADSAWFPWWHPFFRLSRFELDDADELTAQLRHRGVDLEAVALVVLSHLHTDHVGGLTGFRHARVLVARAEWERARGVGGRLRGYLPQHWPRDVVPTLVDFSGPSLGPFAASHDVLDDGRLLLVPTPGHTPGSASLLVRGAQRSCLLVGDLAHTPAALEREAPAIAAWCLSEGVAVLAAHDPDAPDRLSLDS